MQNAHRFTFQRGCVTLLAAACWSAPLVAKEPHAPPSLAEREQEKRRAALEEAQELLTKGDQAYQAGHYADAVAAFSGAREMIPNSPLTAELRNAATQRFAQASVAQARSLSRKGEVAAAKTAVDAVLKPTIAPDDPQALAERGELDDPVRTNPALSKEYTAAVDAVRRLLYTAEGAFNLAKYDEAKKHYEGVLRIDPTNTAARRGMEQVAAARSSYHKAASDQTRAEMLNEVAAAWETSVPPPSLDVTAMDPGAPSAKSAAFVPAANKLDRIVIPSVILEGASLQDAVDLLRIRSAELDTTELDPARRGINFNIEIGDDNSPIGNEIRATRFNLRLTNVPISQVLHYINEQTHTIYTTDDFTVIIHPHGTESKELTTRTYQVPPDFLTNVSTSGAAAAKGDDPFGNKPAKGLLTERRGAVEVLREQGIQFPDGASASFNPATSTLTVTHTVANQDIVSQIIDMAKSTEPVMVCVRVQMISVRETRLKELGFDWLLSPTGIGPAGWIPGTSTLNLSGGTQGPGGSLDDVKLPSGQIQRDPLTSGNRSGEEGIYKDSIDELINNSNKIVQPDAPAARAPGIFQLTKVLTGSSVAMLMRGLEQKKGVDIMTTASTVTRSGQAATVRSVRDMLYPTAYEPPQLPQANNNINITIGPGGAISASRPRTPLIATPSHPTGFEKREVGMTLEVTPTADANKRFVEVTLAPSLVEFDGFVNYGSPIFAPAQPNGLGILNPLAERQLVTANRILMPVFSVHKVATSVSVVDGATIVIGGMLQHRIQNIEDHTPILGDLPVVGRLFQTKSLQPISTAVVFLVTVQLVDPTGKPFDKH